MKKYDLLAVTSLLEKSDKWLAHYYEQYPILNAVYHYAPKHPMGRWCKVVIPLKPGGGRKPDLTKPWLGKIMSQDYGMVTIMYKPEGSRANFEVFAHWLHLLVSDPERLMVISDVQND
jgi:hypothetical protein